MKRLIMMFAAVAMICGQTKAQEVNDNVSGTYSGNFYTVVKATEEVQSDAYSGTIQIIANEDGSSCSMELSGFATKESTFNSVKLDNVKLETAADGNKTITFDPLSVQLTTQDGKTYDGKIIPAGNENSIKGNSLSLVMMFPLSESEKLFIYFNGTKPTTEQPVQSEEPQETMPE
ncbi:hypothetical protein ETF27_01865 [Prevotella brunnea]|uniref:Uncharacterized protein n=1 Tax=Prevotella brunnea TaxID=2508867 RepID=A0A5C8GMF6_9BACT|nr:calycin-like domain-containing protein [Prevotella brunnea]MDR0185512.1 hypothetical protein [Prevotella brunnea]TXJ63014.1 hypothetical protein ETF27_01865 [Prevotella brunnea]